MFGCVIEGFSAALAEPPQNTASTTRRVKQREGSRFMFKSLCE